MINKNLKATHLNRLDHVSYEMYFLLRSHTLTRLQS